MISAKGEQPPAVHRRAKRSLGQNFLVDPNLQRKIVDAAGLVEGDLVLEVGPGTGALTEHLVERGVRLMAVELDDDLAAAMEARYDGHPRVTITRGDILKQDFAALTPDWSRTHVVANIPYNITTPIVFRLLKLPYPADIVLTMQTEVAARMLAGPGSRTYGALSVGVALHAQVARLFKVPRSAFRPVPRVESMAVRLTPRSPPALTPASAKQVRALTRAAFSWRRKQLGTILRKHPGIRCSPATAEEALARLGVSASARPEELAPEGFLALSEALASPL